MLLITKSGNFLKIIERKEKIPVGYRYIQCGSIIVPQSTAFTWMLSVGSSPEVLRFIIVGFQTDKNGDQVQNPSIFDNVNVNNTLNTIRYPPSDYALPFEKQQLSRVYGDAALFRSRFYNMSELVSNPNFTPAEYKTIYPLFLFDVSKQSERLKYSITDIHIRANFGANMPAGTKAYAVVISDRLINFQSDGNKMSVMFLDIFSLFTK